MNNLRILISAFCLFVTTGTYAAEENLVLKQISPDKSRAVVYFQGTLLVGADLYATFKNGRQCPLKVLSVKEHLASLDTTKCKIAEELYVGQVLEPALFVEDTPPSTANLPPLPTSTTVSVASAQENTSPQSVAVADPELKPASRPLAVVVAGVPAAPSAAAHEPVEDGEVECEGDRDRKGEGHGGKGGSDYEREFTDLQYMPDKGQFGVEVGFSNPRSNFMIANKASGNEVVTIKDKKDLLSASIGFGLSDQFSFGISFGYVPKEATTNDYGVGSTLNGNERNFSSSGTTDPLLGFKYRFVEQNRGKVNADIDFSYSPKGPKARGATTATDGNVNRGGDLTAIDVEIGQKLGTFNYSFAVGYNLFGGATAVDADSGAETQVGAYNQFFLGAQAQLELTHYLFLGGSAALTYFSSQDIAYADSSVASLDNYWQPTLGISLTAVLVPKALKLTGRAAQDLASNLAGRTNGVLLSGTVSGTEMEVVLGAEF